MSEKEIPEEINDHLKLFGKESWEVDYGEKCPLCNVRIDEYDMCGCGSRETRIFSANNYGRAHLQLFAATGISGIPRCQLL